MTCETALERILDADPEELSGETSSPLGEHLWTCARCRTLADEVLEGQAALAAVLEAVRPRTDVEKPLEAIRAPAGGEAERERSARRRGGRRWAWRVLPVAAAAVLAGLLLLDAGGDGGPAVVTPAESGAAGAFRRQSVASHASGRPAVRSAAISRPPRVGVSRPHGVTIIQTSNPKISVVWIQSESD